MGLTEYVLGVTEYKLPPGWVSFNGACFDPADVSYVAVASSFGGVAVRLVVGGCERQISANNEDHAAFMRAEILEAVREAKESGGE